MYFASLQIDEISVRLSDLDPGLNVIYLPSPDKRRMIQAALRASWAVPVEESCCATICVETEWGSYRCQIDTNSGRRTFRDVPHGCSAEQAAERLSGLCPEDFFAHVCCPSLGDVGALQLSAYHVCGKAIGEQLRAEWEKLLDDLEKSATHEAEAAHIERLKEERAVLEARLGLEKSCRLSVRLRPAERQRWRTRRAVARFFVRHLLNRMVRCQDPQQVAQYQQRIELWRQRLRLCAKKLGLPLLREVGTHTDDPEILDCCKRLRAVERQLGAHRQAQRRKTLYWVKRAGALYASQTSLPLLTNASQLLAELSGAQLVRLSLVRMGKELVVEQSNGKRISCDLLSKSERVAAHLALCLAAIAQASDSGCSLPLIINDSLRYLSASRLRIAIEKLRQHARQYGQVLLLTSQPHVVALCRSLGIAVYRDPVHRKPITASDLPSLDANAGPLGHSHLDASIADPSGLAVQPMRVDATQWVPDAAIAAHSPSPDDCSTRLSEQEHKGSAPVHTGRYLNSSDLVERLSWLPGDMLDRLRDRGILTVGALLRADPNQISSTSNPAPGESEIWHRIQAEVRLLCSIDGLRPYDARLLVACGITHVEQLARLRALELYRLIEALLRTPEGTRLIRDGKSEDMERLTQWLRLMRTVQAQSPSPSNPVQPAIGRTQSSATVPTDSHRVGSRGQRQTVGAQETHDELIRTAPDPRQLSTVFAEEPLEYEEHSHVQLPNDTAPQNDLRTALGLSHALEKKVRQLGITRLEDLVGKDPQSLVRLLNNKKVTEKVVCQWQSLADLLLSVPGLRPHEAQLLVLAGVHRGKDLRASEPHALFLRLQQVARSARGRKVLGDRNAPTLQDVGRWICKKHELVRPDAA